MWWPSVNEVTVLQHYDVRDQIPTVRSREENNLSSCSLHRTEGSCSPPCTAAQWCACANVTLEDARNTQKIVTNFALRKASETNPSSEIDRSENKINAITSCERCRHFPPYCHTYTTTKALVELQSHRTPPQKSGLNSNYMECQHGVWTVNLSCMISNTSSFRGLKMLSMSKTAAVITTWCNIPSSTSFVVCGNRSPPSYCDRGRQTVATLLQGICTSTAPTQRHDRSDTGIISAMQILLNNSQAFRSAFYMLPNECGRATTYTPMLSNNCSSNSL